MKIYTKTGDQGSTSLYGGERVSKNNDRINAYGTVDELNALLGLTITETRCEEIRKMLIVIQNDLFTLGSDLAAPIDIKESKIKIPRIEEGHIAKLEEMIDRTETNLTPLKNFILPGGSKGSSLLHFSRTVCRRAERHVVALMNTVDIGDKIIIFLNRLSDLLFVLARYENKYNDTPDVKWET